MNRLRFLWKILKFTYSETKSERALSLIVAARPGKD